MNTNYTETLADLQAGFGRLQTLIQAGFDLTTPAPPKRQSGKTLQIAKVLGNFTTKLKGHLKNHPETAEALDLVIEHLKTVSPGQIAALDWSKASALFEQMGAVKAYEAAQAGTVPAVKPKGVKPPTPLAASAFPPPPVAKKPGALGQKGAIEPTPLSDPAVPTAVILGLKTCAEFLQRGDSLDVILPRGDKTKGMAPNAAANVADATVSKVPNLVVDARCKAIVKDRTPFQMAAEAAFAVGMGRAAAEAETAEVEPEAIDMIMHMVELVLADLHDHLESVDIPSIQDVSLILGIPLQPDESNGELGQQLQGLAYSVDELMESIASLDASTQEAFNEGLEALTPKVQDIDQQLTAIREAAGGEEEPEEPEELPADPAAPPAPGAPPAKAPKTPEI